MVVQSIFLDLLIEQILIHRSLELNPNLREVAHYSRAHKNVVAIATQFRRNRRRFMHNWVRSSTVKFRFDEASFSFIMCNNRNLIKNDLWNLKKDNKGPAQQQLHSRALPKSKELSHKGRAGIGSHFRQLRKTSLNVRSALCGFERSYGLRQRESSASFN